MNAQPIRPLVLLTALLLALLALAPATTSVADAQSRNGNIIANTITSLAYDPVTSNATIGGEILCSAPTQLTVFGSVTQYRKPGQHHAQYYGGIELLCDTTPTSYTVTVTRGYESDRLVPGPVTVGFWAEYCDASGCGNLPTYQDMRLRPTP
jgi:hypothetical protein